MSRNGKLAIPVNPNPWHEIEDLYFKILELTYAKKQHARAMPHALRLLRLLEKLDPQCESLLGMASRCLIAELDDDIEEAVRYRLMEIAGIKKLLDELDESTLEAIKIDHTDYSDRLDLLALNYLDLKRYDDALAVLNESEAYCREHGIPFDGKDIRADVKKAMRRKPAAAR